MGKAACIAVWEQARRGCKSEATCFAFIPDDEDDPSVARAPTMGRGRHVEAVLSKLPEPTAGQSIVRIVGIPGGNLLNVMDPSNRSFLCRVPSKFKNRMWVLKGGYLIVDMAAGDEDGDAVGKVQASLAHHLYRDQIKHLKNRGLWPAAFDADEGTNDQQQDGGDGEADGDEYAGDDLLMQRNANRRNMYVSSDEDEEEEDEEEEEDDEDDADGHHGPRDEEAVADGNIAASAASKADELSAMGALELEAPSSAAAGAAASAASSASSLLGPLPPIDAPPPAFPMGAKTAGACSRSADEQAALEAELDELHAQLGVQRGHALQEAMKPSLIVPSMPLQMAVSGPAVNAPQRAALAVTGASTRSPAGCTAPTAAEHDR